jgi:molybdenum cofactor cytidylyltransferase
MGLVGVILAAGESTRMGRDKALLPWPAHDRTGRKTLLSSAIEALGAACDLVIVVAGKNVAALAPVVYACGAFLVTNPNPDRGQFSSLQTGLHEVLNHGRDSAMVTLVDRPSAATETLSSLTNAFEQRKRDVWAVIPAYEGTHGHPILIARELIEAFLKAPASSSARDVEHANQQHISYLKVADALVTSNIDTPQDYASLQLQRP